MAAPPLAVVAVERGKVERVVAAQLQEGRAVAVERGKVERVVVAQLQEGRVPAPRREGQPPRAGPRWQAEQPPAPPHRR